MTIESQRRNILGYMLRGLVLSPEDARRMFGCNRLAARIWEIRKVVGVDVRTHRSGRKTWAEYSISEENRLLYYESHGGVVK